MVRRSILVPHPEHAWLNSYIHSFIHAIDGRMDVDVDVGGVASANAGG